MMKCDICDSHRIYNENTREEYSLEYFFNHVAPIKKGDYNYYPALRRHINTRTDRYVSTCNTSLSVLVLHVDTYLKDNMWRVQVIIATTTIDINFLSQFINRITMDSHTIPGSATEVFQENCEKPWLGFVLNYNIPFIE